MKIPVTFIFPSLSLTMRYVPRSDTQQKTMNDTLFRFPSSLRSENHWHMNKTFEVSSIGVRTYYLHFLSNYQLHCVPFIMKLIYGVVSLKLRDFFHHEESRPFCFHISILGIPCLLQPPSTKIFYL